MGQSHYYSLCPAVLGGVSLSCFACMHITRKLVEFYRPHVQCCMYTILFHLALIFLLTLWPNTPTLDAGKMPLDLQRGPKRNVSTRMNGVATECNQGGHGPAFVFCELCGIDRYVGHGELIVGHSELNDVRKHLATSKHQDVRKAMSGTSSL